MYDIFERKQFSTVGELRQLLASLNDDTKVLVTGDDYCWFHVEEDQSAICLDTEDLEDCYEDDSDYVRSSTYGHYSPSAPWNAPGMSVRDFI